MEQRRKKDSQSENPLDHQRSSEFNKETEEKEKSPNRKSTAEMVMEGGSVREQLEPVLERSGSEVFGYQNTCLATHNDAIETISGQIMVETEEASLTSNAKTAEAQVAGTTPAKTRFLPVRECNKRRTRGTSQSSAKNLQDSSRSNSVTGDEEEDSEDETLNGFIVFDSESESEEVGISGESYSEIIASLSRRPNTTEWSCEADMCANLGKSLDLCMRAVCTIYRRQTREEKLKNKTIDDNGIGFSKSDATRGSMVARFLLGGDPDGPIKKTAEELQKKYEWAPRFCEAAALRYSKQLFKIYKDREDRRFKPL